VKISKSQLKQIIKEEIEAALDEKFTMPAAAKDMTVGMGNAPDQARRCKALENDFRNMRVITKDWENHDPLGARDWIEKTSQQYYECYPDRHPNAVAAKKAAAKKAQIAKDPRGLGGQAVNPATGKTLEEDLY
jgi:hypothetical protein